MTRPVLVLCAIAATSGPALGQRRRIRQCELWEAGCPTDRVHERINALARQMVEEARSQVPEHLVEPESLASLTRIRADNNPRAALRGYLDRVTHTQDSAPMKRAILFAIWTQAATIDPWMREAIVEFVRERLPPGSQIAFTDDELARYNRDLGAERFDPYGTGSTGTAVAAATPPKSRRAQLADRMERLWSRPTTIQERKAHLLYLWSSQEDDDDRATVKQFLRDHLPQGSPFAFTDADLGPFQR
jgi:hypothetical protein